MQLIGSGTAGCLAATESTPACSRRLQPTSALMAAGFSLIELLIVMAVAAILVAIAYGSYSNEMVRTHRVAAQNAMLEIANRQQQHFISNRSYATSLTPLGYALPTEVAQRYTITLAADNTATPPTFLITMTPVAGSSQAEDGNLTLNQAGVKTPEDKWK